MATLTPNVGITSPPRLTPYMSNAMFKLHRRRGVDVSNLVSGGRPDEQDAALAELIEAASAWMDSIILMTLAATIDTVLDQFRPDRYGYIKIHPRYRPVVALTDFWSGPAPSLLTQATDLSQAAVQPDRISMPLGSGLPFTSDVGPLQFGGVGSYDQQIWCRYSYANGFPVTWLAEPVSQGDLAISVEDCTGIIPGQTSLKVYALQDGWRFTAGAVSATSGPGTVACPAAPYAVPTSGFQPPMVSALQPDAIQACVLAGRAMVKDTGAGSVRTAGGKGGSSKDDTATAADDYLEAEAFLRPYILPAE